MAWLFFSALFAFLTALALTPLIARLARGAGIVDRPDGIRKFQSLPVPLLGGLAVFTAWFLTIGLNWFFPPWHFPDTLLWMVMAAGIVVVTGIIDDCFPLRPRWKLLGQALAASIAIGSGIELNCISLCGYIFDLGFFGSVFAALWLIGAMNAFNMIDGLDGFATTIGFMTCAILTCAMAMTAVAPVVALPVVVMAAALAGFLPYNLSPARIFLGDSGSMLIGLVVGVAALEAPAAAGSGVPIAIPILVLAVPILDGVAAVVRRCLTGVSIFAPDRGHVHHHLQRRGWTDRQITLRMAGVCAVAGAVALLSLQTGHDWIALLTFVGLIMASVHGRFFGYYEYQLALERIAVVSSVVSDGLRVLGRGLRMSERVRREPHLRHHSLMLARRLKQETVAP